MIKSIRIPKAFVTEVKQKCRCLRCGHQWTPTKPFRFSSRGHLQEGPKKCPSCHSRLWYLPYIRRRYAGKDLPIAFGMGAVTGEVVGEAEPQEEENANGDQKVS